jgi:hypothetical protein
MKVRFFGLIAACVSGLFLLTSPQSSSAQTEFRGAGFIADFVNCPGYSGISQVFARVRPAGAPGNSATHTRASIFFPTYAYNVWIPPNPVVNQWQDVLRVGNVGHTSGASENLDPMPRFRLLPTPSFTTVSDTEIHLIFELLNFDYIPGCQIRGNLLLGLR